jgi:hypothetical protein
MRLYFAQTAVVTGLETQGFVFYLSRLRMIHNDVVNPLDATASSQGRFSTNESSLLILERYPRSTACRDVRQSTFEAPNPIRNRADWMRLGSSHDKSD